MQLPQRAPQHVIETASWKVFANAVPSDWVIREINERDYGVDAYLELVAEGVLSGELCSVQLKGTDSIIWQKGDECTPGKTSHSIKVSTANYWMNLPVPVFLVLTDNSTQKAYFAAVKDQMRLQYDKLQSQQSISFTFTSVDELGTEEGRARFLSAYLAEKRFKQFHSDLRLLLVHWHAHMEYINENQNRDGHLMLEPYEQLMMEHIHDSCKTVAEYLGVKWPVPPLTEIYQRDQEVFKQSHKHQYSVNTVLQALRPLHVEILIAAQQFVLGERESFWKQIDPVLCDHCLQLNFEQFRNRPAF